MVCSENELSACFRRKKSFKIPSCDHSATATSFDNREMVHTTINQNHHQTEQPGTTGDKPEQTERTEQTEQPNRTNTPPPEPKPMTTTRTPNEQHLHTYRPTLTTRHPTTTCYLPPMIIPPTTYTPTERSNESDEQFFVRSFVFKQTNERTNDERAVRTNERTNERTTASPPNVQLSAFPTKYTFITEILFHGIIYFTLLHYN